MSDFTTEDQARLAALEQPTETWHRPADLLPDEDSPWARLAANHADPLDATMPWGAREGDADERLSTGRHAGPGRPECNCQTAGCPDGPRMPGPGDPRMLLSCAPGVVTRMSKERVRNGEWEDIATYGRDARVRVHKPAVDLLAGITLGLEEGVHDLGALLDRSAPLHSDAALRGDLRELAAEMDGQLRDLRALGYRGWVKTRPPSLARTDAAYPVPYPAWASEVAA